MRKFKKGDRVRGVDTRSGLGISKIVGLEGTIINYPSDSSIICVEFDKPFDGGHDGNGYGRGKDNHCFNLNAVDLELIDEKEDEIELKPKKKGKKLKRFTSGDRVKFIGSSKSDAVGKVGTVRGVHDGENFSCVMYEVEFDENVNGHSCESGTDIQYGWGWNCEDKELESYVPTFKEGDWIWHSESKVVDRINMADYDGTSRLDSKGWVNNCDLRIATDREIELRLISDAKKKGLVLGSRVIVGGHECNISGYKYQKKSAMQKENGIILVDNNAYSYCIDDVTIAPVKKVPYQSTPPDKMYFEEGEMVLCIKYSSTIRCPYIGQVGEVVYVTNDIINVKFPGGMWGFDRKFIGDIEATSRRVDRMPELITVDFEVKYHHEDLQESIIIRQIDPSLLLLL